MKTAVAQAIDQVTSDTAQIYTHGEVLEMLNTCQIIQDGQIKIAYLQGGMAVLQKSEIGSDEYFATQFNDSI